MTVYFKNAGHCTRCDEPFGGNATAYMVREDVAWTVLDGYTALTQQETVPVCDACVTAQELAKATIDATCVGCGQRMRLNIHWRKATCSNRCEQRERRKRYRAQVRNLCTICFKTFQPKRGDAKFCSSACRQRAYRRRATPEACP
jgi:hypothetical protein